MTDEFAVQWTPICGRSRRLVFEPRPEGEYRWARIEFELRKSQWCEVEFEYVPTQSPTNLSPKRVTAVNSLAEHGDVDVHTLAPAIDQLQAENNRLTERVDELESHLECTERLLVLLEDASIPGETSKVNTTD